MGKSSKIAAPRSKTEKERKAEKPASKPVVDISDHLPPFALVLTVMACSGFMFVYAFRDVFATGRNIGGAPDEAYLVRCAFG